MKRFVCVHSHQISIYPLITYRIIQGPALQQSIIAGYILNNYTDCCDNYRDRCDWQTSDQWTFDRESICYPSQEWYLVATRLYNRTSQFLVSFFSLTNTTHMFLLFLFLKYFSSRRPICSAWGCNFVRRLNRELNDLSYRRRVSDQYIKYRLY